MTSGKTASRVTEQAKLENESQPHHREATQRPLQWVSPSLRHQLPFLFPQVAWPSQPPGPGAVFVERTVGQGNRLGPRISGCGEFGESAFLTTFSLVRNCPTGSSCFLPFSLALVPVTRFKGDYHVYLA